MKERWEYCTRAVSQCKFCKHIYSGSLETHKRDVKKHMSTAHPEVAVTYHNKAGNFAKL